jgi:hypothetical protein
LVKITPFLRYHKKTLILVGILRCQISCETLTPLLINATYMDLIEKLSDECNDHTKVSLSPIN